MGFLKRLFGGNKGQHKKQSDEFSMEEMAKMLAPDNPDPQSDYVMAGTISGQIDSIGRTMGPDVLERTIVILTKQNQLAFVFTDSVQPSDCKAFFPLKSFDRLALLKHCAGKRDTMSYMTVDLAGRDIWKKLKEHI